MFIYSCTFTFIPIRIDKDLVHLTRIKCLITNNIFNQIIDVCCTESCEVVLRLYVVSWDLSFSEEIFYRFGGSFILFLNAQFNKRQLSFVF